MQKVALITGASRGIGAEIARLFAQKGVILALNYRQNDVAAQALAEELRDKFQAEVLLCKADVANTQAVKDMVSRILQTYGQIDILVNNAGIAQQKLFTDITDEDWERMINTNLRGSYACCREVLPHMIHEKSGSIVNISSMWGLVGASCEVHYSAAKAGLIGLTKALAKEVGLSGIRVNCVAPGVIDTEMNAALPPEILNELKEETPLNAIGRGEDVAKSVWFLASEESSFVTGQVLSVNGGFVIN